MKHKQTPYDRVLWALVSLKGRAEWTELRIRTKLIGTELDAILAELAKDGRITISSRGSQNDTIRAQWHKMRKMSKINLVVTSG